MRNQPVGLKVQLRDYERVIINEALAACNTRKAAAQVLGLTLRTLYYRMSILRITVHD